MAAEIIATVAEAGIALHAPPRRIAYPDVPIPFARPMEQFLLPSSDKIVAAVASLA